MLKRKQLKRKRLLRGKLQEKKALKSKPTVKRQPRTSKRLKQVGSAAKRKLKKSL